MAPIRDFVEKNGLLTRGDESVECRCNQPSSRYQLIFFTVTRDWLGLKFGQVLGGAKNTLLYATRQPIETAIQPAATDCRRLVTVTEELGVDACPPLVAAVWGNANRTIRARHIRGTPAGRIEPRSRGCSSVENRPSLIVNVNQIINRQWIDARRCQAKRSLSSKVHTTETETRSST